MISSLLGIGQFLISGRGSSLVLLLLTIVLFLIAYNMVRSGHPIKMRRLTAIDAIDEAIGRAAEMGKPVHYTPGLTGELSSWQGPQMVASVSILGYVGELCARYDVRLMINTPQSDAIPLMEETLRTAYLKEGKPENFDPKMINYQPDQSSMVTAILGTFQREKPAANMMIGGLYYEAVVIGEAANFIGAMQVGGTANTHQLPFIVATCDYALIGEDLYAAAAYISKAPIQIASIASEDWAKFIVLGITLLGFILEAAGVHVISGFLKW